MRARCFSRMLGGMVCGLAMLAATSAAWAEPVPALVSRDGNLSIGNADSGILAELRPALFENGWKQASSVADAAGPSEKALRQFRIQAPSGAIIRGTVEFSEKTAGAITAVYTFKAEKDFIPDCLYVGSTWPAARLIGCQWEAESQGKIRQDKFPEKFVDQNIFSGATTRLKIGFVDGGNVEFRFPEAVQVLIQDDRRWGSFFSLRMQPIQGGGGRFAAGTVRTLPVSITSNPPCRLEFDQPVTVTAGPEWISFKDSPEIVAGSALDLSAAILKEAPAGSHGRIVVTPDGHFAFADRPNEARRFRGVNLCFSAQYLPHDQADRLADRLVRLGYNSLRLHHYEGNLLNGRRGPTDFDPQRLDQFDYLAAACIRRGIYLTTDLFVSRPVSWKELGVDKPGNLGMDEFKMMVPVMPAARANWKQFSRTLLTHKNPYTGKTYAEEPALAWLSLINEGNLGNFHDVAKNNPDWRQAWNRWLRQRYPDRQALIQAWKNLPVPPEWPAQGEIAIPETSGAAPAVRDWHLFLAATDFEMTADLKKFLREELKCQALVTNNNSWTNHVTDQAVRTLYDYVDDHHYFDHPNFLEKPWRLPSRSANLHVPDLLAANSMSICYTRLLDRPFTISEFNVAAPGRHRHSSGLAFASLAARQDWDILWRFAYSHNDRNLFETAPALNYFDLVADPINLAADRAGFFLFQRGDMAPLASTVAIGMTSDDLANPPAIIPQLTPNWGGATWLARLGCLVGEPQRWQDRPAWLIAPLGWKTPAAAWGPRQAGFSPYSGSAETIRKALEQAGRGQDDGAIRLDPRQHSLLVDTPCSAGGSAPAGKRIATKDDRLQLEIRDTEATAWISTLDGKPITSSRHLLFTHLTEAQNQGARFAETARNTLLDWGKGPPLIRRGRILVRLRLDQAANAAVYALSTNGERLGKVPSRAENGHLVFEADTAGGGEGAPARMLYEIAVEK